MASKTTIIRQFKRRIKPTRKTAIFNKGELIASYRFGDFDDDPQKVSFADGDEATDLASWCSWFTARGVPWVLCLSPSEPKHYQLWVNEWSSRIRRTSNQTSQCIGKG